MTVRFIHNIKNKLLNYLFLKNDFNPNLTQMPKSSFMKINMLTKLDKYVNMLSYWSKLKVKFF